MGLVNPNASMGMLMMYLGPVQQVVPQVNSQTLSIMIVWLIVLIIRQTPLKIILEI